MPFGKFNVCQPCCATDSVVACSSFSPNGPFKVCNPNSIEYKYKLTIVDMDYIPSQIPDMANMFGDYVLYNYTGLGLTRYDEAIPVSCNNPTVCEYRIENFLDNGMTSIDFKFKILSKPSSTTYLVSLYLRFSCYDQCLTLTPNGNVDYPNTSGYGRSNSFTIELRKTVSDLTCVIFDVNDIYSKSLTWRCYPDSQTINDMIINNLSMVVCLSDTHSDFDLSNPVLQDFIYRIGNWPTAPILLSNDFSLGSGANFHDNFVLMGQEENNTARAFHVVKLRHGKSINKLLVTYTYDYMQFNSPFSEIYFLEAWQEFSPLETEVNIANIYALKTVISSDYIPPVYLTLEIL